MNKVVKRLLLFFIGIPVVMGIVYVKYQFHLPLQVILSCVGIIAANEMHNMIKTKYATFCKPVNLILTAAQPFLCYFFILAGANPDYCIWVFLIEVLFLFFISIFSKSFDNAIIKISTSLLIIFYCGFLLTYLSRITAIENSRFWVALFLIIVFMCDSAAWFFGILFGKNNKGFVKASPNKSIAGFIGGILGAVASAVVFSLVFSKVVTIPYWKIIILSFSTSICAIIGDLIESVFKRSLGCKDSGTLIPGRGGLLDSIDSILIAIPCYYAGLHFLFGLI